MTEEDTTPSVAILGAGPIGLEAALYARYLGYQVAVFEKHTVANNVRHWGHVKMFSPFGMNRSRLGVAALQAQNEDTSLPGVDVILTGSEYAEQYLIPLSKSDLLSDCIHQNVEVITVGRDGIIKGDVRDVDRSNYRFRILIRDGVDEEIVEADFVLDSTGVYNQPQHLGHGGILTIGERDLCDEIDYYVPDILGNARHRLKNRRVLVVGGGYSAATSISALGELRRDAPETQVTWITRRAMDAVGGPITRRNDDRLQQRDDLAKRANALAKSEASGIKHVGQTSLLRVSRSEDSKCFVVSLGGNLEGAHEFDAIIANVGYRPDSSLYEELQVDTSYATQGPRKLADRLFAAGEIDCLDLESMGGDVLTHPEPGFFILGSKSFGRNANFLLVKGIEQIRDVFAIIAEREDLDVYKTMENLVQ